MLVNPKTQQKSRSEATTLTTEPRKKEILQFSKNQYGQAVTDKPWRKNQQSSLSNNELIIARLSKRSG